MEGGLMKNDSNLNNSVLTNLQLAQGNLWPLTEDMTGLSLSVSCAMLTVSENKVLLEMKVLHTQLFIFSLFFSCILQ